MQEYWLPMLHLIKKMEPERPAMIALAKIWSRCPEISDTQEFIDLLGGDLGTLIRESIPDDLLHVVIHNYNSACKRCGEASL